MNHISEIFRGANRLCSHNTLQELWSALVGNALAALAAGAVFNICTRGLRYLWKVNTATYLCCVCSNIKVNRGPGSIFLVFFALLRHTYTCTGRGDLIAIALLFAFCVRVQDRNECGFIFQFVPFGNLWGDCSVAW
jgi:hypothetical protein